MSDTLINLPVDAEIDYKALEKAAEEMISNFGVYKYTIERAPNGLERAIKFWKRSQRKGRKKS